MRVIGVATINADVAASSIIWQTGFIQTLTRTGVGDYLLTIDPNYVADALESAITVGNAEAVAASGAVQFGYARPADNTIQVTSVREAGGGAASVRADVDFSIKLTSRFGTQECK